MEEDLDERLGDLADPGTDALTAATVAAQEEDHFLQRERAEWEEDGAWTLRIHVLCGARRDWWRAARKEGEWVAPLLGPSCDMGDKKEAVLVDPPASFPGKKKAPATPDKPSPSKKQEPPPPSPATPHSRAMAAAQAPSVRSHDYPSDFLEKWAEAATSGSVADKLPPHAMPVSSAQIAAALAHCEHLPPRLRQVTAVPAWDGHRIVGYAILHATPPPALLRSEALRNTSNNPSLPKLDLTEEAAKTAPCSPEVPRALDRFAIKLASSLQEAGAAAESLSAALPTVEKPEEKKKPPAALKKKTRRNHKGAVEEARISAARSRRGSVRNKASKKCATRAVSPAELALFDAGLRAPLEALVSTLYLASVKDQNPLLAIELLASAACQGRRTLLPWSGEWADPETVGNGGDDDPCEKIAAEMELDIMDVASAVHRGREFVEPVLELGLGSAGNSLMRALALFGAELVAQCSTPSDRVDAAAALRARGGSAAVRKLSKLLAAARGSSSQAFARQQRRNEEEHDIRLAGVSRSTEDEEAVEEEAVTTASSPKEASVEEQVEEAAAATASAVAAAAIDDARAMMEEDDDDFGDDDEEANLMMHLASREDESFEEEDDDDHRHEHDEEEAPEDEDGFGEEDEDDEDEDSFAALAETLLARALLGRDKYAPKALMRAASVACQVLEARGMSMPPEAMLAGYAARLASASAQRDVEGVERALHRGLMLGSSGSSSSFSTTTTAPSPTGGRVLAVVLVLAFEESVYVVLEAHYDALLKLCAPKATNDEEQETAASSVIIGGDCWTGGGFGHVEVMMQLPQPLRLACDRANLHAALLALPAPPQPTPPTPVAAPSVAKRRQSPRATAPAPAPAAAVEAEATMDESPSYSALPHEARAPSTPPPTAKTPVVTPWLTLALLPGADDLVAVPLAGLYIRTAASASGLGGGGHHALFGGELGGAPPPFAAALIGDGVTSGGNNIFGSTPLAAPAPAEQEDEDEMSVDDDDDDEENAQLGLNGEAIFTDQQRPASCSSEEEEEKASSSSRRAHKEARAAYVEAQARVGERHDLVQKKKHEEEPASSTPEAAVISRAAALLSARAAPSPQVAPAPSSSPPLRGARRKSSERPATAPPATPAALLLASYYGFRDGLRFNGPPLHGAGRGSPKPRPSMELLKALARTPLPHLKLCGRVVSASSVRTALSDAATIGPEKTHLCAVRCPRRATVDNPGNAMRSTTYLPHVYTLVATRTKPRPWPIAVEPDKHGIVLFPNDSSPSSKKRAADSDEPADCDEPPSSAAD